MKLFGLLITFSILCVSPLIYAAGGLLPGSGTVTDPYLIEDYDDFIAFSADSAKWAEGVYVSLEADLDLTPAGTYSQAPIAGDGTIGYDGILNGNGYTISNLSVNATKYSGLFGIIGKGTVKKLNLDNCTIVASGNYAAVLSAYIINGRVSECSVTGSITGGGYTGGICGYNYYGFISQCSMDGSVNAAISGGGICGLNNSGRISESYAVGSVTGGTTYTGGICGINFDTIYSCSADCSVEGTNDVGGLCGSNLGRISESFAAGAVTGDTYVAGLAGKNSGSIFNCYALGSVSGVDSFAALCGYQFGISASIKNSFWDIETHSQTIGYNLELAAPGTIDNVLGLTVAQMQTESVFTDAGWDFASETDNGIQDIWAMDTYPVLYYPTPVLGGGDGTEANPYLIQNLADFTEFCRYGKYWETGTYTALDCNLDLAIAGTYPRAPIAWDRGNSYFDFEGMPFEGVFDGRGYVISNLNIDVINFAGLFGSIKGGIVKNIGLQGGSIAVAGAWGGWICGLNNYGSISNCYSNGSIAGIYDEIEDEYNNADDVGGLVGENYFGSISSCLSNASITGNRWAGGLVGTNYKGDISNSYATGPVSGLSYIGGLCGENNGSISYCFAAGAVTYSVDFSGGLVGRLLDTDIQNCFWDVDTSGITDPESGLTDTDGMIGLTTTELQTQSTYTDSGWDFVGEAANGTSDLWRMPYLAPGYPITSWYRDIPGDITGSYGVDMQDFGLLSSRWLNCYQFTDFEALAANWLAGI